jgi:hypothetical protein
MGTRLSNKYGKHVSIDADDPDALGVCDYSGMIFNKKDLIKQMEWRGNALIWTGFLVGRPYADKPNEQLRPPMLPPDPVPVSLPRLPQNTTMTWSQGPNTPWSQLTAFTWATWSSLYNGYPALPDAQRLQALQNVNWSTS